MAVTPFFLDITSRVVGDSFDLDVAMRDPAYIRLANASQFFITVDTKDGKQYSFLPGEVYLLSVETSTQFLGIKLTSSLNQANPGPMALVGMAFSTGETFPGGNYPFIGPNLSGIQVSNSVLQATQIFNPDLLAPGSSVLFTEDSLISPHNFGQIGQDGSGQFGSTLAINPLLQVSWTIGGALYARSLSAGTPVTLVSNTQETGYCGLIQNNCVNTSSIGVGVNFKTTMTNTPSSITITDITTLNAGAANIANIRTTGFTLFWTPVAAGQSFREAQYTTVGN